MPAQPIVDVPDGLPYVDFEIAIRAPIEMVYSAQADPVTLVHWVRPSGMETHVDAWDYRTGGLFRIRNQSPTGQVAFHGAFHVVTPEFVVHTREDERTPGVVVTRYLWFDPIADDGTRVRIHYTYPSLEARDTDVVNGVVEGLKSSWSNLDELLARNSA